MVNTIIHPKPAHLAGDSAKFHSKLVGGKSKKMKKSMKKSMKGKKGKKPMRKTMKKKTGGDYDPIKGFQNMVGLRTKTPIVEKCINNELSKTSCKAENITKQLCDNYLKRAKKEQEFNKTVKGPDYIRKKTDYEKMTKFGENCVDLKEMGDKYERLYNSAIEQGNFIEKKCKEKAEKKCKDKKQVN